MAANSPFVVSPDWLQAHLKDPGLTIVDAPTALRDNPDALIDADGDGFLDTLVWRNPEVGNHLITLRAIDELGLYDPANDQTFALRVVADASNRAPRM